MVERQLPKLDTRVRFPSPAPLCVNGLRGCCTTAPLYGMRGEIVEPVFGWIKQQMGFWRWTVQGLDKVNAQWALLCAAYNLKAI